MKKNKKMLATIASVCAMACSLPVSAESASALPIKALTEKAVDANPYMASGDTNIHHDGYNTDTTDSVLPVAIYPEINVSYEKSMRTPHRRFSLIRTDMPSCHCSVVWRFGISMRMRDDRRRFFHRSSMITGDYVIQSSYSFVDESNRIVCPTSNNHVLMLKATDEDGNVLLTGDMVKDATKQVGSTSKNGASQPMLHWSSTKRGRRDLQRQPRTILVSRFILLWIMR